jgi:hypothetical protein
MNRPSQNKRRLIDLTDIDGIVERLPKESADNAKRQLRKPLFSAFDMHKGNIAYGAETETAEEKEKVLAWREDLKDLKTEAFKEIPQKVKYYL